MWLLQEFLDLCGKKKSFNISFFMEEDMVFEKQRLAELPAQIHRSGQLEALGLGFCQVDQKSRLK